MHARTHAKLAHLGCPLRWGERKGEHVVIVH